MSESDRLAGQTDRLGQTDTRERRAARVQAAADRLRLGLGQSSSYYRDYGRSRLQVERQPLPGRASDPAVTVSDWQPETDLETDRQTYNLR